MEKRYSSKEQDVKSESEIVKGQFGIASIRRKEKIKRSNNPSWEKKKKKRCRCGKSHP